MVFACSDSDVSTIFVGAADLIFGSAIDRQSIATRGAIQLHHIPRHYPPGPIEERQRRLSLHRRHDRTAQRVIRRALLERGRAPRVQQQRRRVIRQRRLWSNAQASAPATGSTPAPRSSRAAPDPTSGALPRSASAAASPRRSRHTLRGLDKHLERIERQRHVRLFEVGVKQRRLILHIAQRPSARQ